jgi:hypothetical protein
MGASFARSYCFLCTSSKIASSTSVWVLCSNWLQRNVLPLNLEDLLN